MVFGAVLGFQRGVVGVGTVLRLLLFGAVLRFRSGVVSGVGTALRFTGGVAALAPNISHCWNSTIAAGELPNHCTIVSTIVSLDPLHSFFFSF